MYHVSAQGIDERMINVHYYYYYYYYWYCNDVKMILLSFHWSKHIKCSKERCLLWHHFIVHLGSFKTALIYLFFCFVFYAVPHEKVRKMTLFHTHTVTQSRFKQIILTKIIYTWWPQNWEGLVSYQWCNTKMWERTCENSVSNAVWESPLQIFL